jgi:23S rRNA pseudouridine2605 synthase
MPPERLQKIIAAAGVASRRKAEELITTGRVAVNGKVVTELGTKADPEHDHIRVDGKLLRGPERYTYIVLNKPKGYVTTVSDPEGRPTVMELVRGVKGRVYPVGRLDWASEGLLLLTNDGGLANVLMKAASHVPKTYVVKVAGQPEEPKIEKLRRGVSIAEKGGRRVRTAPAKIQSIREGDNPWLEVTITEGRNRQIRKMFEEIGHHVEKIRRVKYGPLSLDVAPGEFRNLTPEEVARLKSATKPGRSEKADASRN